MQTWYPGNVLWLKLAVSLKFLVCYSSPMRSLIALFIFLVLCILLCFDLSHRRGSLHMLTAIFNPCSEQTNYLGEKPWLEIPITPWINSCHFIILANLILITSTALLQ